MSFARDENGGVGLGVFSLGLGLFSRNVDVDVALAATYSPTLTFAGVGDISPGGNLAATYSPALIFMGSGNVPVDGTMDADYAPSYTFAGGGSAADVASGTMAVTHTPTLTFAGTGTRIPIPVNISASSFTPPTGGEQAKVNFTYSYAGADTLEAYAVTGTNTVTVSKAQLVAGSGGTNTIEFVDGTLGASPHTLSLSSGLTSASEAADRIVFFVREANDGGESDITEVVVSNLDYTAPTFVGATSTPADGATASDNTSDLVAKFNEDVVAGSGNFYLRNTTDAETEHTVAIGSCTISGDEVTIPFNNREATDAYAVRWDAGVVTNAAGIDVAENTGDTAWNFTAAAASTYNDAGEIQLLPVSGSDGTYEADFTSVVAGEAAIHLSTIGDAISSVTLGGSSITEDTFISSGSYRQDAFSETVSAGTVTLRVVLSTTSTTASIYARLVSGPSSSTIAHATGNLSAALTVASGDALVASCMGENFSTGFTADTVTWTGDVTKVSETQPNVNRVISRASEFNSTAGSKTISWNANETPGRERMILSKIEAP